MTEFLMLLVHTGCPTMTFDTSVLSSVYIVPP